MNAYPAQWVYACKAVHTSLCNIQIVNLPNMSEKLAVMIELRDDPFLIVIFEIFLKTLADSGWSFMLIHGINNEHIALQLKTKYPHIHTLNLNVANLTIEEYNHFLLNKFWYILPEWSKHILRFELDTLILSNKLDSFLEYDLIGAPWYFTQTWLPDPNKRVGNGGLTLRNKDAMIWALDNIKKHKHIGVIKAPAEDVFITFNCNIKLAPLSIARKFSAETWPINDAILPIGYHKPFLHMSNDHMFLVYNHIYHVVRNRELAIVDSTINK